MFNKGSSMNIGAVHLFVNHCCSICYRVDSPSDGVKLRSAYFSRGLIIPELAVNVIIIYLFIMHYLVLFFTTG